MYVAGSFQGDWTVGVTTVSSRGQDLFVTKYDPDGKPLWITQSGGPSPLSSSEHVVHCSGIALDLNGDCFVVASHKGIGTTLGSATLDATQPDLLVAKIDSREGNVIWAKQSTGGEHVVAAPCEAEYAVSHIRLGDTISVTLSGPKGSRDLTAIGLDLIGTLTDRALDLFDRLIVATALVEQLALVTVDKALRGLPVTWHP